MEGGLSELAFGTFLWGKIEAKAKRLKESCEVSSEIRVKGLQIQKNLLQDERLVAG